ncbi:MAG: 3-isopropylmalate dehydrogenase [Spirochaetales bacterium]|nr:3-isopropylmalate dehydrogenase [Spirochaetales bacterium]
MKMNIALVPGDGIGPEIIAEAVKVLEKVGEVYGHEFCFDHLIAGGASIDLNGVPLTEETINRAKAADAVMLGAVGGPKWDNEPGPNRPERALLGLRSSLGLFCNLRPAIIYPELSEASPLKSEVVANGIDIMVVRELTGGIYFGEKGRKDDAAYDVMYYSRPEIERISKKAFDAAMLRDKHVTVVDKANVLESSRLWREVTKEVAASYPEVTLDYMYVDNAAMQLVKNPGQFDVVLTENMFGDILSDEASMITGSIGMLPSASLREDKFGMYEPIHGSAPDIAGKGISNPIATILSAAMMLRYTFSLEKEADAIERAVKEALRDGLRTMDIKKNDEKASSTEEAGLEIVRRIR